MSNKNSKIWQILNKFSDNYAKQFPEYSRLFLQLLYNRGLKTREEVDAFLNTDYARQIVDPFLFKGMDDAVNLIVAHIKARNKIFIYGDYDADGATASAVLAETIKILKGDVEVYIPDRVSEGYSLNKKAIEEIAKLGAKLMVTVDCGVRNKAEVSFAKEQGLDVIITDHHMPPDSSDELPQCIIINPAVPNETYPFKYLAGVGVAYKVACALISKSKLSPDEKDILALRSLDLVAVGTVADCVTVFGENRILIKKGLEILDGKKRVGLDELMKSAKINGGKRLDSWNIGFQIAPRLNAAGRMDHANTAYELLTTNDRDEAALISTRLNERNADRQKITEEITAEVDAQVNPEDKIIIGVCPETVENESWKEGVIGLVAGRIAERYYRPTLVITRTESGLKGSGRSIDGFNIIKAVEAAGELLEKYGGHPAACGFSLLEKNLSNFMAKIKEIAEKNLAQADLAPKLKIEAEAKLSDITKMAVLEIEKLAPFGQNNERPRFVSFGVGVADINNMGYDNQHIKLKIKDDDSGILSAVGFGQTERWKHLQIGDKIDIVYYVEINEFNGRSEVQLKIIDIKQSVA